MNRLDKLISDFSITNLIAFLRGAIPSFKPEKDEFNHLFPEDIYDKYESIEKIGEAEIDNDDLIVIASKTNELLTERTGKKNQYEIAKKVLKHEVKDASLFVFYDDEGNFRFSFVRANYLGTKRDFTDFKRYTYYVSPGQTNKTFIKQVGGCNFNSIDEIIQAFSVEPLNKQFYQDIAKAFYELIGGKVKIGSKNVEYDTTLSLPSTPADTNRKLYQEFAVRLIGRTIFCWFLKNKKSAAGKALIPEDWLSSKAVKHDYYHSTLEKLFFLVLNTKISNRKDSFLLADNHTDIPFLNGGLFEPQADDFFVANKANYSLQIPDEWFKKLFETLEQYNFTIDENSIYDAEVSIDPEMLGTIFENLLAEIDPDTEKSARKATGSFYTPREIVDYMVEQSLVQYLKTKTGIENEEQLLELFKEGGENKFDETATKNMLEALSTVKILDPACGSGAFPMGALHKIINALHKLDPDAAWWKARQLANVPNALARQMLKEKLDGESADYVRKLGVIQNSIYGVDIQPIATEISKLRSFLSLVIDETIVDETENRGIQALPNLEFKFVTANTLKGLEEKEIDFIQSDKLQDRLKFISIQYLQAYGEKKKDIKKEFNSLQTQIIKQEIEKGDGNNKRVIQLTSWKPFSNESNPWFDPYWMFGVEKFDIVIGNPPYIQLQKAISDSQKLADLYKTEKYETFERTGDIYALFYERGINMLSHKGLLCYITSNKWMRANYGKSLRNFFSKKNPLILIDLGPGIFNSATVDTNILLIENYYLKEKKLKALTLKDKNAINSLMPDDFILLSKLSAQSWIILSPEEQAIKKKIEGIGTPLKNWDINIYRGVLTGYNEAFIIDGKTRKELIAKDPKCAEIIKPILRGRDIKRYKAEFADLWLIGTFPALKLNIDEYPAIKEYLEGHLPKIKQTGETFIDKDGKKQKTRKKTGNKWFETQDQISYHKEFEKEKIVWKRIGSVIRFSYSKVGELCLDSTVIGVGNRVKYLTALLNSKLFIRELLINSPKTGTGDVIISVQALNPLLVYIPNDKVAKPFETLVDIIISKKERGEDTTAEEQRIDVMVYKLYDLTYEEVHIIDPNFPLSREEYDNYRIDE